MKNIFLSFTAFLFAITFSNAQQFSLGLNAGLITGDFEEVSDFSLTLESSYLYEISDNFQLGVLAGYSNYFTSIDGGEDENYVPIALALRFPIAEKFSLGADLGYAFTLKDEGENGLYYSPRLNLKLSESLALTAAYKVIQLKFDVLGQEFDLDLSSFNFGLEFNL